MGGVSSMPGNGSQGILQMRELRVPLVWRISEKQSQPKHNALVATEANKTITPVSCPVGFLKTSLIIILMPT